MEFKYDFVAYGTSFEGETALKENEIAADVGGRCLLYDGEDSLIIDHHFSRSDNFPSASAAVLHLAPHIFERLKTQSDAKVITLKSHQTPDFDAFCSLYLIRRILDGSIPCDGWENYGLRSDGWAIPEGKKWKINWFNPSLNGIPSEYRAPILLAAYASCVDNCKPLRSDRAKGLHSILQAGQKRGRNWETDGAFDFFMASEKRIQLGLNPLFDIIFGDASEYAPELAMLSREEENYKHDIARSRCTIVNLPVASEPFTKWFSSVAERHIFHEGNKSTPDRESLCPGHRPTRQVDGVYLRDPECLLFKEWARSDRENSPHGMGFIFTAVAYSSDISDAKFDNFSSYFFSLDPERANGAHLYPVWVRLQLADCQRDSNDFQAYEVDEIKDTGRFGFENRLADSPCLQDPWFDGNNYQATIIVTPNFGTRLNEGVLSDLTDDEVALIVRQELEWNIFLPGQFENSNPNVVLIEDFSTRHDMNIQPEPCPIYLSIASLITNKKPPHTLRFASVLLNNDVSTSDCHIAESIGKTLWPALCDPGVTTVTNDFLAHHLFFDSESVTIWNQHGIAIASKSSEPAKDLNNSVSKLALIMRSSQDIESNNESKKVLSEGRDILKQIISLQLQASLPHNSALRNLMDATRIEPIVASVTALNKELFDEAEKIEQSRRDIRLQKILAWGTALSLLFAWNQVESISIKSLFGHNWLTAIRFAFGLIIASVFILLFIKSINDNSSKK
jgi:hypothetical protein